MLVKTALKPKQIRWMFYSIWLLLGFLQAIFTEISSDEAYYWKYAQNLQWGYFDHPPMIALLIKLGGMIFNGVLGVRLLVLLLNTGTIYLLEKLSRPDNIVNYYAVIASILVFHLGGILAIPDAPLLFFAVVYLIVFEQFLNNDSWKAATLLGLCAALMLYSKYHGVLVIGFSILAQPKLLLRPKLYIAGFIATALMLPHIYWQYLNHWPSIKYHLYDRSVVPYQVSFTLEYLLYTFLLQGPIVGAWLYVNTFRTIQPHSSFNRSLQFITIGVIAFFLFSSFRGRIEPHWTLICAIPLVALFFRAKFPERMKPQTLQKIFVISVILIFPARALLVAPISVSGSDYHNWKSWAMQVENLANGAPVAVMNSYQKAAKYEFYTGNTGHSLNNIWYRRNQYDLWNSEEKLWGKKVLLLLNKRIEQCDSLNTSQGLFYYVWVDDFASYSKIRITTQEDIISATESEPLNLMLHFEHNYHPEPNFQQSTKHPTYLSGHLFKGSELVASSHPGFKIDNSLFNGQQHAVYLLFNAPPGAYHLVLSVQCGWMPPSINSPRYPLMINK